MWSKKTWLFESQFEDQINFFLQVWFYKSRFFLACYFWIMIFRLKSILWYEKYYSFFIKRIFENQIFGQNNLDLEKKLNNFCKVHYRPTSWQSWRQTTDIFQSLAAAVETILVFVRQPYSEGHDVNLSLVPCNASMTRKMYKSWIFKNC